MIRSETLLWLNQWRWTATLTGGARRSWRKPQDDARRTHLRLVYEQIRWYPVRTYCGTDWVPRGASNMNTPTSGPLQSGVVGICQKNCLKICRAAAGVTAVSFGGSAALSFVTNDPPLKAITLLLLAACGVWGLIVNRNEPHKPPHSSAIGEKRGKLQLRSR